MEVLFGDDSGAHGYRCRERRRTRALATCKDCLQVQNLRPDFPTHFKGGPLGANLALTFVGALPEEWIMSEKGKALPVEAVEMKSRRTFVKTTAKLAIGAPAVTLLLDASTKPAEATIGGGYLPPKPPSDLRLKKDVSPVEMLPNGLQLYAFRYWNDDRIFVGVMAQDLLEDERFRHAVIKDETGYYTVDLGALGLEVVGSREEFFEAGKSALRAALPLVN
jgi:hypothetical protein